MREPPIGDGRAVGLVAGDGPLDWLYLPRPDSPSLFGALLDPRTGGCFRVRPTGQFRTERRYLPGTNVLETTFRAPGGAVVLGDAMAASSEEEKRRRPTAEHELLREIEGLAGEVELEVWYEPRPDHGRSAASIEPRGRLGLWCRVGRGALVLDGDVPLAPSPDGRAAVGRARVRTGERCHPSCSYASEAPAVVPPLGAAAAARMARTSGWWTGWAERCRQDGPHKQAVCAARWRSSCSPTRRRARPWPRRRRRCPSASAAGATRLPLLLAARRRAHAARWSRQGTARRPRRSWAGCSTRPASPSPSSRSSTTCTARRGCPSASCATSSATAARGRSASATRRTASASSTSTASWPTRCTRSSPKAGPSSGDTPGLLRGIGETVCRRWREPDDGIWEERGRGRHYTQSNALGWVALDRLIRLHEAGRLRVAADRFRAERDAIRATVEARGYDARLGSYVRTLGVDELDASLLTLPLYGYVDAGHPRMRSTLARIRERLGRGALVHRYARPDGKAEGAFGICGFWAVECLARAGERAEAAAAFEELLGYAKDVGSFAEEVGPDTGAAPGNFPQAFTHVGLVNAALALAEAPAEVGA